MVNRLCVLFLLICLARAGGPIDECVPLVACNVTEQAVKGCGYNITSDSPSDTECHVELVEFNCTEIGAQDCCICQPDPLVTPVPTPKPTPMTDEDCNTTDSIEVFEKTQCAVHRIDKGQYEFWIAMALPNPDIAAIIDFGQYVDVRNRGTCDNRLDETNVTMYPWVDLFNESNYDETFSNTNDWLKLDGLINSTSGTTYPYPSWHKAFFGPELLDCEANNGSSLVTFGMDGGNTSFVYSGSIFARAVLPMDLDNETAGEMFMFEKECAFTITVGPKTGTVAITYLAINIDFSARWVKSICDKNNDLHIIIETCIDDFATLCNIDNLGSTNNMSTFTVESYSDDIIGPQGAFNETVGSASVTILPDDAGFCVWVGWDDTIVGMENVTVVTLGGGVILTDELNITNGNELDGCIDCNDTAFNCTALFADLRAGMVTLFLLEGATTTGFTTSLDPQEPVCDFDVQPDKCCQQWDLWHADTLNEAPIYEVLDLVWDVKDGENGSVFPNTEVQAWVTIDIESPCFEEIAATDDLVVMCEFYTDLNFTDAYLFNGTDFEATNVTQVLFDCEPIYVQCDIMLDDDAYCDFFQLDITEVEVCDANLTSYNASEPVDAPYECLPGTATTIFNGTDFFNYTELARRLGGVNVSSECCINARSCWDIHKQSDLPQIAVITYEISMKVAKKKRSVYEDFDTTPVDRIHKKRTILLPDADPTDSVHNLIEALPFEIECQEGDVFSPALHACVSMAQEAHTLSLGL